MTGAPRTSRRAFCFCCLAAPAAWLGARVAHAAPSDSEIVGFIVAEAQKATIHVHRLRGGVAVLEGSGGNVAVLTGPDGKLLVDAGIAVSRPQMATALELLGPEPITRLVNTHWHFDHTGGNAWLHEAGATILAQETTRKRLLAAQRVADWNYEFPPAPPAALPTELFDTEYRLQYNGATLEMRRYAPAHTDSDSSVRFVEADILHTGDTYWNGVYPMIDYSSGGHIDGMILAAERNLATATDRTIVVSGHGQPVSDRAGLQAYCDMLVGVRQNVATARRGGASFEAVLHTRPTAAWDAVWGNFVISPAQFTRLVYEGI